MKLQFTKNVAINTKASANSKVADFYKSLGLETRQFGEDFTVLGPSPYSCYVVSWDPKPETDGEVCLQFETDDVQAVKKMVESKGGKVMFFGTDAANPKPHLWFRDPAGNLMNVVEME